MSKYKVIFPIVRVIVTQATISRFECVRVRDSARRLAFALVRVSARVCFCVTSRTQQHRLQLILLPLCSVSYTFMAATRAQLEARRAELETAHDEQSQAVGRLQGQLKRAQQRAAATAAKLNAVVQELQGKPSLKRERSPTTQSSSSGSSGSSTSDEEDTGEKPEATGEQERQPTSAATPQWSKTTATQRTSAASSTPEQTENVYKRLAKPPVRVCNTCWRQKHGKVGGKAHLYDETCLKGSPSADVLAVLERN